MFTVFIIIHNIIDNEIESAGIIQSFAFVSEHLKQPPNPTSKKEIEFFLISVCTR